MTSFLSKRMILPRASKPKTSLRADYTADNCRNHRFGLHEKSWLKLRDSVFWVTGAGSGAGRALTITLAAAESKLFITGRNKQKLQETVLEVSGLGLSEKSIQVMPGDIRDEAFVSNSMDQIIQTCGRIEGVVQCAALPPSGEAYPLQSFTEGDWENTLKTNIIAPALILAKLARLLKQQDSLKCVFFTSQAGWSDTEGFGPYNVSKAALNNLTISFARELQSTYPEKDIQVNALNPGEFCSEMNPGAKKSPYSTVPMTLALLTQENPGPNGFFFHADGRHLEFCSTKAYPISLSGVNEL